MRKIKIIKRVLLALVSVIVIVAVIGFALFYSELRSLSTLKTLDEYGMYQMTYHGDYGFDDFLKIGAKSDDDIQAFVSKRLLKGLPINIDVTGGGCTVFAAKHTSGQTIFGRNFDFTYSPSLQVFTRPKNGYASVSTVNLSFAGYSEDNLPSGLNINSFLTLAAPYLPFDGMNEKGVAIALLAVPEAHPENDPNKITLNTTTAIRLVLDKAANVDEAVDLLREYNIYFSGDIKCHYLIADKSGKSVLVEYWDGKLQTVTPTENYQVATNFIAYDGLNIGEGFDEFDRYDRVSSILKAGNGAIQMAQATTLLSSVGVYGESGEDKLQWTAIYNLSDLSGTIFAHRNVKNQTAFKLLP